jgi:prepilin-type N-terminal cleavage/methylation domain-containing protein
VRLRFRRLSHESGYSLVELLTAMAILSFVVGGITTLFVQGSNAEIDMNRRFVAQQEARVAMDKMRRDAHCSSKAIKPTSTTFVLLNDPCQSGGVISWCTVQVGTTGVYKLYRSTTSTCDATKTSYAANLVNAGGAVFTYFQQSTDTLAKLRVDLKSNAKPTMAMETYELKDDIVFRNSTRTCIVDSATDIVSPPSSGPAGCP